MDWDYFAALLRVHAAHLWRLLHWGRQHSAALSLLFFVLIGVAQVALAYEAGVLAVKALPQEVADERARKRYQRFFLYVGFALLFFTVTIGFLTDKRQSDADKKTQYAQENLRNLKSNLGDVLSLVTYSTNKISGLQRSMPSSLTAPQRLSLREAEAANAKASKLIALIGTMANATTPKATSPATSVQQTQSVPIRPLLPIKAPTSPFLIEQRSKELAAVNRLINSMDTQGAAMSRTCNELASKYKLQYKDDPVAKRTDELPWAVKQEFKNVEPPPKLNPADLALAYQALNDPQLPNSYGVKLGINMHESVPLPPRSFRPPETVGELDSVNCPAYVDSQGFLVVIRSALSPPPLEATP